MPAPCACEDGAAGFDLFGTRSVGRDETAGRFAEVEIWRCLVCGRPWLRYSMEQEAFSRSGRWARGLVSDDQAAAVTPQSAEAVLSSLDWRLEGGSYFNGVATRRSGPLIWG